MYVCSRQARNRSWYVNRDGRRVGGRDGDGYTTTNAEIGILEDYTDRQII